MPEALESVAPVVTSQGAVVLQAGPAVPHIGLPVRWGAVVRPSVLAALVASLLMSLGLNVFVAMLSVGFLAVVFYRQRQPGTVVKAGTGAGIGAVSGLLWFAISAIFQTLLTVYLHKWPELRSEMLKKMQEAAATSSDPQVQTLFEYFKTPSGFTVLLVAALVFLLFVAILLGTLGGVLGGVVLGRRDRS